MRRAGGRQGVAAGPHRYALMVAYWFAVVATLLFATLYGWHSWQRYERSGMRRLALTTTLIATAARENFDREASGLRFLARRLQAINALRHPHQARHLLREFQRVSPEIASAEIVGADGQVVASTAEPEGRPLPDFRNMPRIWPGVRRALQHPGLYIHRPLRDPLVGRWVIGFSDTLVDPVSKARFLVTTPIRFRNFEALFAQLPLSTGLAVGIMRDDYYIEGRAPVPRGDLAALLGRRQNGILAQTLKHHPRAARGIFSGWVSADREYRYGVFARIPGYPLIAFADVPRTLWLTHWWRRQAEIPLVFLAVALAFSGFAYRQVQALAIRWEAEAVRRAELLEDLVTHDPLTGLLNRKGLYPVVKQMMARARRDMRLLALGFLDVDDFKGINDHYGHAAGDEVLKTLAQRLEGALRGTDRVARIGGDEFVLLIEGLRDKGELAPIMDHLKSSFAVPFRAGRREVPVRVSLGVSFFPIDTEDTERLLDQADRAMYAAKGQARSGDPIRMRLYDEDVAAGPGRPKEDPPG